MPCARHSQDRPPDRKHVAKDELEARTHADGEVLVACSACHADDQRTDFKDREGVKGLEQVAVALDLPLADREMISLPLFGLVFDEFIAQLLP